MDSNRTNIFEYIQNEVVDFKAKSISLGDGQWNWNMYEHINRSFLMKHSKFTKGSNELGSRPFKNIIRPILNVGYRSEGFDVKNIESFVNDSENYHKSMIVRKFHPKWAVRNHIDKAIDESVESYVDYGGTLVKNVNSIRPEVVPLQRLAFVDQRDILSGSICEKHDYSIDQLLDMKGKWWDSAIDQAIVLSRMEKANSEGTGSERANSKSIEVFELHSTSPETWLVNEDGSHQIDQADENKYIKQINIVTYYKGTDGKKIGITLFSGKEKKQIYKFLARDEIYNRALGWGGVEELFEPQIWTNYDIIQIKEMLDVASLMILNTQDQAFAQRNKVTDMKKGEIVYSEQPLTQVNIQPINMQQFVNSLVQWEQSARVTGSASDPQLGLNPSSGTPLGTTQIITDQGQGMHEYRRGQVAAFWEEIYREWIIPSIVTELGRGAKFIEQLTLGELQQVTDALVTKQSNKRLKEIAFSGKTITQPEIDAFKELQRQKMMKMGVDRFFEALDGELKSIPVDVSINVASKQKDLNRDVSKMSAVFQTIISNPQGFQMAIQDPAVADLFNQMIEWSGMNQINFGGVKPPPQQLQAPQGQGQQISQPVNQPVNTQ